MPATILIVDDEKHTREGLELALEEDYDVYLAENPTEAFNLLDAEKFDVVLTDLKMAGKSGMTVIDRAIQMPYHPVCIMMTAYGTVDLAVEAMKRGAHDFLTKPVNLEKLEILISRALHSRKTQEENVALHQRLDKKYSFDGIIGESGTLASVLERVKLVAPATTTVLLEGETGTGKELIAQALHQNSNRIRNPFVAVHCAALPANLLESELFGHEKGAFTGASEKRIGRFESAHSGTLFLDEIGEIDASTQVKLLRFLETKTFERVGSIKPVQVDVRLVCATNRDLKALSLKGEFREDLYYRLDVVKISLPPLRHRMDDIPLLIEHFLTRFAEENELPEVTLTPKAMSALQAYRWPGNIRELRNFCENLVVLKQGGEVNEYDMDPRFLHPEKPEGIDSDTDTPMYTPPSGILSKEENEKRLLRNALVQTHGNRTQAAQLLGISRRTLHRKVLKWPELDTR
ncbi:MAG: sigma-54-dependent Fis family transcriptional regulator [Opitutae bacterium]|nr:sigma-54-dependent Fis family transcriptional regulator [Opitutae bacterium]MBT5691365.1 sigma-54-dependent Fis family transcriptional regulator [Opitutae bacterium]MBT6463642.1 sigma-54-dependent Fis family transcriptional regulator [Opitutae bacterium]MBT6959005.1 sigma-54-dependent Fis family transcriptional regulator [Opitutae bacterium]MBT7855271.1 sigma-54-dependent Fis family transcriptional regulator [Opitutae bacterium]